MEEILSSLNITNLDDIKTLGDDIVAYWAQKCLDTEFDVHMGYDKWDQKSRQVSKNYRKGKTTKIVKTPTGKYEFEMPRDSEGTFDPVIVPKYQRHSENIERITLQMVACGQSVEEIEQFFNRIYEVKVSKDEITRITNKLLPEIRAWQQRPLCACYPIIFVAGMRFKVKEDGTFTEKSLYIIIGINTLGIKEVLGIWLTRTESAQEWLNIFNELKMRGVKDILLACSDNLAGISKAFKAVYPDVLIQKCIVHQVRNATKYVSFKDLKAFTADMKGIYKAANIEGAKEAFEAFKMIWNDKYGYAIKSWENNWDELVSFYELPFELRKLIYTKNVIENLNKSIRKITKTKGGFISDDALIKLVYLRISDINAKWSMKHVKEWLTIYNQIQIMFPNRLPDDITNSA